MSAKSNIINDRDISKEYESLLQYIPNHFHVTGQYNPPQIMIPEIDKSNALQYPLSDSIISKIKSISQPSSFGIGTKTIHDSNIRNCSELIRKQFNLSFNNNNNSNNNETSTLSSRNIVFLERIRKSLAPHIEYIVCEPYKLLLYETNSFFKPHVDTAINDNQFGSLILSLSYHKHYKGGDFLLRFNDKEIKWNPINNNDNDKNNDKCEYIAFYSDVEHEIEPVFDGIRVVITCNLLIPNDIKDNDFEKAMIENKNNSNKWSFVSDKLFLKPTENMDLNRYYSPFINKIFNIISKSKYCKDIPVAIVWIIIDYNGDHNVISLIENLLKSDQFHESAKSARNNIYQRENGVCLVFSHRYHGKYVNPLTLKGEDMYLYRIFKQYFGIYLSAMTVKAVIGKWSDEYSDDEEAENMDYIGQTIDEWNENDKKTKWNIVLGKEWWNVPTIIKSKFYEYSSKFVVLYNNKKQTLKDAKYVNNGEECYGNVGTYDIENQYYCTGLLLTKYH